MRLQTFFLALALGWLLYTPSQVDACMWDYDTLKMESQRFPSALELLTGKFLRHSKDFYQWRIQDRLAKIKKSPDQLSHYDDLAVAYDKVGKHEEAIKWMLKKEKRKPGLYETQANLGTFYIHNKQWEKGLSYIKKAIKINPNAHFGREIFQAYLVEYLLFIKGKNKKLELPMAKAFKAKFAKLSPKEKKAFGWLEPHAKDDHPYFFRVNFLTYLMSINKKWRMHENRSLPYYAWDKHNKKAVKGLLGMMRFGNFQSPVLLEALGDLLSVGINTDAKLLAARAYLHASYRAKAPSAQKVYRKRAEDVLYRQTKGNGGEDQITLAQVEKDFKAELAKGKAWFAQIQTDEKKWIADKVNPEKAFDRKYYKEPVIHPTTILGMAPRQIVIALSFVGLLLLLVFRGLRLSRRRRRA